MAKIIETDNFKSGRAGTNYAEPDFTSLLHSLKKSWDTEVFEKSTEPILAGVSIDDPNNARSGSVYNY